MGTDTFRAIVVGSGPVGLVAAHALSKAGIDFVVLERRPSVLEDAGASIVLEPRSIRVLAQLGLLDQLQAVSTNFMGVACITLDKHRYKDSTALRLHKENHGTFGHIYHRAQLLQVLYNGLDTSSKSRIFTSKKVINISCDDDGVRVHCADGTYYDGSIVIGADGANSKVRPLMRTLSLAVTPTADANPEKPFLYEFRTMWCNFPLHPSFTPGKSVEAHSMNTSVQLLAGRERAWMFLYERLEQPKRDKKFYSQDELVEFAERLGDLPLNEEVRIKDMFPKRHGAGMIELEEGVLQHWSWGRVVLAGDAAYKLMPNIGQGLNNGIQDIVVLTNGLNDLLNPTNEGDPDNKHDNRKKSQTEKRGLSQPSTEELSAVFKRYQDTRMEVATAAFDISARAARLSAWTNYIYWFFDRWILSKLPRWAERLMFNRGQGHVNSHAHIFTFVKSREPFIGRIPWVNRMPN
ncbi:uncharacterized protein F4822DRAFT_444000 [Hypoxylon trugodes]|uniref:uncharacterized protein n=1 Tax=Hypoxylon trugodes TaxID=326681 RepID=UPI00218E6EF5|nr:uncharacterized protein F4822DRAFT_444000 [Hypoxylon trugodes]KAI1387203.1 hypothetical protein F4822DRAFT_444000 [Hypoxylon trugodes]